MFRYSSFLDTLLKAMTHKYIRRIPKGVTKTGATKYMYYYAGQEGHGKGIAHDEELTAGASFAFGEHGKTRYHAHIVLEAGDKITIQYDDGDKKGQKVTMSKKEFRDLLHKEHASAIQGAKEKAAKQLKDFKAGKEKGVKVKQSTLDKLEERVQNLDALVPTAKEDEQSPFTQFAMSTPTNYDDINKINEALSKTATTLDTREKTINFLTAYKEHVTDILRTLDKVVTTQDLNKEFGKLTTMLQDRSDLLLRMAKNDYQRIRVNIPLITRENLEISGVRKDLEDRIDYDIFLINKMSEDVSPQYMEEVQFFYEGVLRRKEMEDARKEKPFVVSSEMQSFIDRPFLTASSSEHIYQIPSVIYRQQADSVIDFYLSHNMGKKFAKIPNIREVLKDQIERRVDKESIINMNNIDDIRAHIRALPSDNKSITFEKMPVLQTEEALNKLFDIASLDKLKNKLDSMSASVNKALFKDHAAHMLKALKKR